MPRLLLLVIIAWSAGAAVAEDTGVRRALILCGHPGNDEYRMQLVTTTNQLVTGLTTRLGFDAAQVRVLFGSAEMAADGGPHPEHCQGPGTAASLQQIAAEFCAETLPDDTVWVIVLGHAYFDGRNAWLNLPGDDVDQERFAHTLAGLKSRNAVIWITTAVSGYFLKPLAQEGRVLISATEADEEIQATLMGEELAALLADPPAAGELDFDRDQKLTLLDLYLTLTRRVGQRYIDEQLLITEHAQLDDNFDGRCTEVQRPFLVEGLDGSLKADASLPQLVAGRDGWNSQLIPLVIDLPKVFDDRPPSPAKPISVEGG